MTESEVSRAEIARQLPRDEVTRQLLLISQLRIIMDEDEALLKGGMVPRTAIGERLAAALNPDDPNGTNLGYVSMPTPSVTAKVTNRPRFLAWVKKLFPGEVERTERVRERFETKVLDQVKEQGVYVTPDGEAIEVDGVEVQTGTTQIRVNPDKKHGTRLVRQALAGRRPYLALLSGKEEENPG